MSGATPGPEPDLARGLLEALPAVTFIDPIAGDRLDYVSSQVEALLGYPRQAWLEQPRFWARHIHPDDAGYAASAYRRSRRTGLPFSAEYRMITAAGGAVWVHVQARPMLDAEGQLKAFAGVMIDVSARRRGEEGMRQSEARYRALVEASPDAIIVTDLHGRLLMANETAARLAGVDHPRRMMGRPALEPVSERDRADVGEAIGRAVLGDPVRGLQFLLEVDGVRVPVEGSFQAIAGEAGPLAVIGVIRDVSDRADAAEARRVAEAKSRFLATMSHELRTPLNSILGFAQLLSGQEFGPLTERQERYVDHIEASGRQLLDLVNEVLDLSRANSGQLELSLSAVPVVEVVDEALAPLRAAAMVKAVDLSDEIDSDLLVVADARRLVQVISNLVSNAVKFTPAGGSVTVAAHHAADDCVIDVVDTGIGIPPEVRDRIFEEFFQVESGRARSGEGSGVGLALARRLVELMGGTLGVESEVGRGSTFRVRLPAVAYPGGRDGVPVHRGAPAAPEVGVGLREPGGIT